MPIPNIIKVLGELRDKQQRWANAVKLRRMTERDKKKTTAAYLHNIHALDSAITLLNQYDMAKTLGDEKSGDGSNFPALDHIVQSSK